VHPVTPIPNTIVTATISFNEICREDAIAYKLTELRVVILNYWIVTSPVVIILTPRKSVTIPIGEKYANFGVV